MIRPSVVLVALIGLIGATSSHLAAQRWRGAWRRAPIRYADSTSLKDRRFIFCRLEYTSVRREAGGQGWYTDYPGADRNFMERLSELSATPVAMEEEGGYNYRVLSIMDHDIYSCPFLFMSDVGTLGLTDQEAARLRDYLLKGGFIYVDDFWGSYAWNHWEREIGKVLPPSEYPIFDIPPEHPLMHALYNVPRVPQIPSIQFWRRSGGHTTSERGSDSAVPHLRAIADREGRLLIVMTHNTDIADGWEREGEEYEYFHRFSADSYSLAINVILYAMSH